MVAKSGAAMARTPRMMRATPSNMRSPQRALKADFTPRWRSLRSELTEAMEFSSRVSWRRHTCCRPTVAATARSPRFQRRSLSIFALFPPDRRRMHCARSTCSSFMSVVECGGRLPRLPRGAGEDELVSDSLQLGDGRSDVDLSDALGLALVVINRVAEQVTLRAQAGRDLAQFRRDDANERRLRKSRVCAQRRRDRNAREQKDCRTFHDSLRDLHLRWYGCAPDDAS